MEIANIMKDKRGVTIASFMLSIVLIIALFSGMYFFYVSQFNLAEENVPAEYTSLYQNLSSEQKVLENKTEALRDTVSDIKETESVAIQGYYAIKGFGQALALIPSVLNSGVDMFEVITQNRFLSIFPSWFYPAVITSLVILIVFALLRAIGGGKDI